MRRPAFFSAELSYAVGIERERIAQRLYLCGDVRKALLLLFDDLCYEAENALFAAMGRFRFREPPADFSL